MSGALGVAQPQRVNFSQMLAGRYFVIPEYQRHYAWTAKQCRELFEDCVLTARNPGRERFMSTITTVEPAGDSVYKTYTDRGYTQLRPLLVVDGQQRLTSILILISTLCRRLNNDAARNAFQNLVLTPLTDQQILLRVIPQSIPAHPTLMRNFFSDLIAFDGAAKSAPSEMLIPAQRRLVQARQIFEEGIENLSNLPAGERVSLGDLLTCVASRLIFILNTLSDVGQAGEVFEGLNNRGLSLSALENLKAFAIYAVQSFRHGESLPGGLTERASNLNDSFNDAIGTVYWRLDRVNLPDDAAVDLLRAFWPLVISRIEQADLSRESEGPPTSLDRSRPVDDMRASLYIQRARNDDQRANLLQALRFMICERLDPASEFFADARRPTHQLSFERFDLPKERLEELRGLHQRLVEMQCSAPFLPILIAHRALMRNKPSDYLLLVRLIERVAFWVYGLGDRNRGTGQKDLALLARNLVDEKIGFPELLCALRTFAVSFGYSIDHRPDEDADIRIDEVVEQSLTGCGKRVPACRPRKIDS
jgi:hypothetical protein